MNKIVEIFIKLSAIYLLSVGVFFILQKQFYIDYKLGPVPWSLTVILIIGAVIPAIALSLVPNSKNYRRSYKILMAVILAPPLLIFSANTYDYLLALYQNTYREGGFYIVSLSVGTLACLLGYFVLISSSSIKKNL